LTSSDYEILSHCFYGILSIAYIEDDHEIHNIIIQSEIITKALKIEFSKYQSLAWQMLRIIGSLSPGSITITQSLLDLKCLDFLYNNLCKNKKERKIVLEISWILSNIAAESIEQCKEVIEHNLFSSLINLLYDCHDIHIIKEITYLIGVCASFQSLKICTLLVNKETIKLLVHLLSAEQQKELFLNILKALLNILKTGECITIKQGQINLFKQNFEMCQGKTLLVCLRNHSDEEVSTLATSFWNEYYFEKDNSLEDEI
jgi:hypothetical protein